MSAWLHRFTFGATLLFLVGCVTPSIPIPPPEPEKVYFELDGEEGTARFQYDSDPSYANAVVYVFNRAQGEGIITTAEADGRVLATEPFPALDGDEIVVTFETDTQLASTCVLMKDGQSNSGRECSL